MGVCSQRPSRGGQCQLRLATCYLPTGQCSTVSSRMGKSLGLPVASRPPSESAAAATRQSAWASVRPRRANSRRHSPACQPSAAPNGAIRSPVKSARAGACSRGLSPRTVSSTLMAHTYGASSASRSASRRLRASARPRRRSISTVVSRRTAANYPTRRSSARRWSWTHRCASSSHS